MNEHNESVSPNALISVIVPVFNADKYLKQCVTSILAQEYDHLEIILIDDGSTDNSLKTCELFAKVDSRIIVIHQDNAGVSAARNAGIEHSRGEYLAFVDGDDYISPHMMECMYKRIIEDQADMAVCGYRRVDEDGHELSVATIPNTIVSGQQAIRMHYNQTDGIMMIPCDKLYSKKLFDRVRFPVGKRCEDEASFYRILDRCERVSVLAEPFYFYVQHEDSFMGKSYSVERLDGVEAVFERFFFYLASGERYMDLLQPEGKLFVWLFHDAIRNFRPKTKKDYERVQEIYKMARVMCSQRKVKWSLRERIKLRFPELYLVVRRTKDRFCIQNEKGERHSS